MQKSESARRASTSGHSRRSVCISAISYIHGGERKIAELDEDVPPELLEPSQGLLNYRESDLEVWQLAGEAAAKTLCRADEPPDLLIYLTENDDATTKSLAQIARRLELPRIEHLSISGHACGNLGPALELARNAIHSGAHCRILLVMADRASEHARVMSTGLSVFSDGAASCLVTAEAPEGPGNRFAVHSIRTVANADTDPTDPSQFILSTVELGKAGIEGVLGETQRPREGFRYALFANYRASTQRFLAAVMGFKDDRLLLGRIAEYGHSFSADLLVSLEQFASENIIEAGDYLLVSATGPHSWSMMDVECL